MLKYALAGGRKKPILSLSKKKSSDPTKSGTKTKKISSKIVKDKKRVKGASEAVNPE